MQIQHMTRNAVIASMYMVLTLVPPFNGLSYFAIQFRISEALLILVWFRKDYAIGLIIGTFIANLFGPIGGGFAFIDAIVGSLVTYVALTIMIHVKSKWMGLLAPVFLNGFYLAWFLPIAIPELTLSFEIAILTGITVSMGEAAVVYGLGLPLYAFLTKQPRLLKLLKVGE